MKKSRKREEGGRSKGTFGSPRHTESRGPGPVAGSEEQDRKGPGGSMETRSRPDESMFNSEPAASGKGIKPKNRTRGDEEDGE